MLKRAVLALLLLASCAAQAADIREVRLWRAPDHTRVVFDMSAPAQHRVITLSNPDRIVLDIDNVRLKADVSGLDFSTSPIRQLRHAVRDGNNLRVVFDLGTQINARSFLLPASGDLHDRLVIDFFDRQGKAAPVVKRAADVVSGRRDIVVAIDAGHGGEDPGAIGPGRLQEKTVVLAIARQLKELFDRAPGYKAVLIRSGDYYIGLRQRRDLARKAQADIMISIHADAFKNDKASGSSVYALSQRGATSASAAFLAQRENSADLVGGVSLADKDDLLAGVLTDLSMTATMDASLRIGDKVLGNVDRVAHLHSRRVEQAAFAVLKSPDIPSILVETGFISNPGEARKLATRHYQQQMANAIFAGVDEHFRNSPPPDTYLAALRRGEIGRHEYVIVAGDTLSEIAKRFRVDLNDILRENGLADSTIRVGQKILIPAS